MKNSDAIIRTIPLAYGTLLLALALYKATEWWKENGLGGSRLIVVLVKDQALYYILYVVHRSRIHPFNDVFLKGAHVLSINHLRR